MAARPPPRPLAATAAVSGAAGTAGATPGPPPHAPGGGAGDAPPRRDSAPGRRRHAAASSLPGGSCRARPCSAEVGGVSCGWGELPRKRPRVRSAVMSSCLVGARSACWRPRLSAARRPDAAKRARGLSVVTGAESEVKIY